MEDKSLAALTLWECLDGRQRGRLATQLKLKKDKITPSPPPAADPKGQGVPGYVDVGITQASAEATLAVEWKIGADAWKQVQNEGATMYVSLHSHHPTEDNNSNKHDISRLPINAPQGNAEFPAAKLNLGGSLRAGLAARILKVTKTKKGETGETGEAPTPTAGDADLPSDDDVAVLAKSEVVNIVTGTLERTWSMQIERVSVMLNTSAIPLTPTQANVVVSAPGQPMVAVGATREEAVATLRDDFDDMTSEEREAAFASMWGALSEAERARLRPHLTANNRGREIVAERRRDTKRTSKAALTKAKQTKKEAKLKKTTGKSAKAAVTAVITEEETTTPMREKPAKKSMNARTAVLIPSTIEPQLEAAPAAQLVGDGDHDHDSDLDAEDWVMLASSETGEPSVNEDTVSTVSLSFVQVSSSIQPSVVWNLTATEYYDWIGVVDAETDETVAKVSINSLVSWTNPVGAHSWSEAMTTVAKKKGLSKKYYAVMWRWHEEANEYHALGYSSNIIRSVVSMERRELVRQNVSSSEHMSAVYKDESLECAQLACAAYQCYDSLTCALPPPLEAVYKISNAKTDTQGFVALDKSRGIAYVAFKGSWELADFMNDADLFLGPFVDNPQLKAQFKMVECWKSIKDPLLELLLKYLKDKTICKITITGHSLGAALACMMMEWILHDTRFDPYKFNSTSLKLFTFACPRSFDWAANADSVKQLDKDRATMLSFVDQNDPVATGAWGFLKYFGYYHVGSVVLLEGSGHAMSNYINLIKALTP